MPRVVAPVVSTYFAALHRRQGVTILTDNQVRSFAPTLDEVVVQLEIGTPVSADLVVVGIGVVPNTEIAAAAGLVCEGGIVVDEFARTSDPSIVAAGDCTWHRNLMFERPHRLESVQNAVDQAKVAAATLLGTPAAYQQVPWFWSDQYDVKLQMAGISAGYDELVTRGDPETGAFSVFYYARGRVIAVDSVNRPAEHMLARRLLASGGQLAAAAAQDPAIDLKALVHANS
jgi:3-phenylpropionate/trans-cinnamate dioxygenase ferredoxin reductase subunit